MRSRHAEVCNAKEVEAYYKYGSYDEKKTESTKNILLGTAGRPVFL
jgi:hypothetical protein